jgi:hypothetical protein
VDGGLLTLGQACERYGLTLEEFAGWELALHQHGVAGLRSTFIQQYRRSVAGPEGRASA